MLVRLMGGLGNQMFQYSAARRLALEHGVPLKLDLSWFDHEVKKHIADTPRQYALDGWRVQASIASAKDLACFASKQRGARLGRLGAFLSWPKRNRVLIESGPGFNESVLSASPPVQLIGYWQSEKYFVPIKSRLREEFRLAAAPCEHAARIREQISGCDAIAVHVRRGDYANNPTTNAYHGVCSIEYYEAAARFLAGRMREPRFFVFSDEPEWVREHLRLPWPMTVVDHGSSTCTPHSDILAMSECSHHVIANSSFSWWGAWLGESPSKTVIAPRQWFGRAGPQAPDLVPERWLRM